MRTTVLCFSLSVLVFAAACRAASPTPSSSPPESLSPTPTAVASSPQSTASATPSIAAPTPSPSSSPASLAEFVSHVTDSKETFVEFAHYFSAWYHYLDGNPSDAARLRVEWLPAEDAWIGKNPPRRCYAAQSAAWTEIVNAIGASTKVSMPFGISKTLWDQWVRAQEDLRAFDPNAGAAC